MSDHLSGQRALADPAIDLTDLYAFPSPSRRGSFVLVLNVFPMARPGALFSDEASYRIRLRPVTTAPSGFEVATPEYAFTCTFAAQAGSCFLPNGAAVSFLQNEVTASDPSGVRIFAGLRLDPFFMDVPREMETRATRRLAFHAQGINTLAGLNVLSIVVEFDVAAMLGQAPGTMFAVAAEAATAGAFPVRLERLGRAEVKNILLSDNAVDSINREHDIRDLYNQEDPFQLTTYHLGTYRARLNANLAFFDSLDGKIDWPLNSDGAHPQTELLLADFLVVDVAKPFAVDSYLEIERALLQGQAYATCGGRSLNEDVIDKLYTLIVSAGNGPRVSDGVDQAAVRASRRFPFLAPPNLDPPDRDPGIQTNEWTRRPSKTQSDPWGLSQSRPRAACQEGAPADARRCPMCLVATQS
jgi:hypothetical protein